MAAACECGRGGKCLRSILGTGTPMPMVELMIMGVNVRVRKLDERISALEEGRSGLRQSIRGDDWIEKK